MASFAFNGNILIFSVAAVCRRKQDRSPSLPKSQSVGIQGFDSSFSSLLCKWLDFVQLAVVEQRSNDQNPLLFFDVPSSPRTWFLWSQSYTQGEG